MLLVPENGDVYCKRITTTMVTTEALRREELAYADSLNRPALPAAGKKIELF